MRRRFFVTWHDDGTVLIQAFEEVLFERVVVERPVDVGGADGGVGHADLLQVRLALVLTLMAALRVHLVLL